MTSAVAAVRRFNRFYTQQIGVLEAGHLASPFTLTEIRILYEIFHREAPLAKAIASDLRLDKGYLSRIIHRLRKRRLVAQKGSPSDGRQRLLTLTTLGERTFRELDARASKDVHRLLEGVNREDRPELLESMRRIEGFLQKEERSSAPITLRSHRPGDLGWVVQRHGEIYSQEYGWNEEFEGLVAAIAGQFIQKLDPHRERCWIAERAGERVGCIFLMQKSERVAQLRLLLVEPTARGVGLGKRLVDECERFARAAGYSRIRLWTQSVLVAARRIYQQAGYELVSEEPHTSFGKHLVAQTWEKRL